MKIAAYSIFNGRVRVVIHRYRFSTLEDIILMQEASMPINIDSSGITVDGQYLPLYSGTIHYWRHAQPDWKPILQQVRETGFKVVATDIPWGIHESGPMIFDFGEKDPSKNLAEFIDLCRENGLLLIVHLGPQHDLDIPLAGLPVRIIRNSAFWALTSSGAPAILDAFPQPFPMISYASNRFYAEFGKFLDALCPILVPRQYPNGPIILCKAGGTVDFGGRYRAYDIDYSQDALLLYRKFLIDKYRTIEKLNDLYSSKFDNFSAILPPKAYTSTLQKDFHWYMDWIAYKEHLASESALRVVPLLKDRKIAVPVFHAVQSITSPTDHYALVSAEDNQFVGYDVAPSIDRLPELVLQIRHMAGMYPFAYAASFPQGADWLSGPMLSPGEEEFLILSSIMFGTSGFNFRMLAECDRWTGSPLTRRGQEREEFASLHRGIINFLTTLRVLESKKFARCLILVNHDIERFHLAVSEYDLAYLGLLPFPNSFSRTSHRLEFMRDPYPESIREDSKNWFSDLYQLLNSQQIEFNLTDSSAPLIALNKYEMVFLPTVDFIRQQDFDKVADYVQRGGHLVVGPGFPGLNEKLQTMSMIKVVMGQLIYKLEKVEHPGTIPIGKGKLTWQPDVEAIKELLTPAMQNAILHDNPALWSTIREGPHNLMFLANPTRQEQTTNITSPLTLKGVWGIPEKPFKGIFQTMIRPMSVQIMEVLP
jgi:beta-galactosidase